MSWFDRLIGISEQSPEQVRDAIQIDGTRLRSLMNGNEYVCGTLEVLSLAQLRERVSACGRTDGRLAVSEVVGNVQTLHQNLQNSGALFQVASQFNLLEMVSPSRTPECGVGIYEHDHTQGPACAIAAGAGTIYRNYFVPLNGRIGQSIDNQIDCLKAIGTALGNDTGRLWAMRNGYALPTPGGLQEVSEQLAALNEQETDELRQKLQIGLHWQTQVTTGQCTHTVSQAYCSALPVAYCSYPAEQWTLFAQLVLEAAYEATFCAAIVNAANTGNPRLFLTLLGGGAFGNKSEWILSALKRALSLFATASLEVIIVSYGKSNPRLTPLLSGM